MKYPLLRPWHCRVFRRLHHLQRVLPRELYYLHELRTLWLFTDAASERRCAFFGIFACEHGDNIISAFKCFVAKRAKSIGSGFAYIGCDKAYTAYLLCIFHKVGSFRCCNLCLQRRYFAFLFFKLRRESRGTGRQFMIICKLKVLAVSAISSLLLSMYFITLLPVTASILRTPDATDDSDTILNSPIDPVFLTCVPPQNSTEKSSAFTTLTISPYFRRIMPLRRAFSPRQSAFRL